MCANPRAPPPESTTPVERRASRRAAASTQALQPGSVLDAEAALGYQRFRPGGHPDAVTAIDEHEVAGAQLRVPVDPVGDGTAGRERKYAVCLAQAQFRPGVAAGRHVREQHDVVVVPLVGVHDLNGRRDDASDLGGEERGAPMTGERLAEVMGEPRRDRAGLRSERHDRKRHRRRVVAAHSGAAVPQLAGEHAGDRERQLGGGGQ